jgi:uncharacterized protein (TIGR01244 family)
MRLAVLVLAFLVCGASAFAPSFAETPPHFPQKIARADFQAAFADAGTAYVAGQPTADALRAMKADGVTTVINLRTQQEMDNRKQVPFDEEALAKELGMTYVHIPLGGPDTPYTPAAVDQAAQAIAASKGKVLLHCTVGWRASHLWAAYLMKYQGMSYDEATRQARAINLDGYTPPNGVTPLQGFLGQAKAPAAH